MFQHAPLLGFLAGQLAWNFPETPKKVGEQLKEPSQTLPEIQEYTNLVGGFNPFEKY